LPGKVAQDGARECTADAGRGQTGGQRPAHDHELAMRLGEFLAVMAADQARLALRFGQDRQLHEVRLVERTIEQPECGGIDHVLGVVQHDHSELVQLRRSSSFIAA
jgi:hypothetical protein